MISSLKSSNVKLMLSAYRQLNGVCYYPLHIGFTESGYGKDAIIKSSIGIGALLANGIGDTIRVSLTGKPVKEIEVGKKILRSLSFDNNFCEVISCPTCSRCYYDLERTVIKAKEMVKNNKKPLKIAIMGCIVNGPGEAGDADLGIAGGKENCVLFKKGNIFKTLPKEEAEIEFFKMLNELLN